MGIVNVFEGARNSHRVLRPSGMSRQLPSARIFPESSTGAWLLIEQLSNYTSIILPNLDFV